MPFPKPPRLDMRQWDDWACDATVAAQILYMGGGLRYPFNTAKFDQHIGRKPGQPIIGAGAARLIASKLPVAIHCLAPTAPESRLDPAVIRREQKQQGFTAQESDAYFKSPMFEMFRTAMRDYVRHHQELGDRFKLRVCTDSSKYLGRYLKRGALVVAVKLGHDGEGDSPSSHSVLLIPRGVKRDNVSVTIFDPAHGAEETTLDRLIADGQVRLDDCGFTAYML